jgi:hypothetical protein
MPGNVIKNEPTNYVLVSQDFGFPRFDLINMLRISKIQSMPMKAPYIEKEVLI